MRFDDPGHIEAWKSRGVFPKIHDRITDVVREEIDPGDGVVLDLCSSIGILGRRLATAGYEVVAAQCDTPSLQLGVDEGVYDGIPLLTLLIDPTTLPEFLAWVEERNVATVVARRCLSEIWTSMDGKPGMDAFAVGLRDAGVRNVVLEGRATVAKPTHPIHSTDLEVQAMSAAWVCRYKKGPVAVLKPVRKDDE